MVKIDPIRIVDIPGVNLGTIEKKLGDCHGSSAVVVGSYIPRMSCASAVVWDSLFGAYNK
jgi:hypothetical protein